MKKYLLLTTFSVLILFSCVSCGNKPDPALTVDSVRLSSAQLEEYFGESMYSHVDNLENRKKFLDQLIMKKIILLEAERTGFTFDRELLRNVEIFWEQEVLKRMIKNKADEAVRKIAVSDKEIQQYYQQYAPTFFSGKTLDSVRGRIKAILRKEKMQEKVDDWIAQLKSDAHIDIQWDAVKEEVNQK